MGVGKNPLDFENFSKKGCFLSFEWEKSNFITFSPPLEKVLKNPLIVPPREKYPSDAHVQDEGSLGSSTLKAFQNKCQVACFVCYVIVVKRMKFKTNLVFEIFVVVVCSFMNSHKDMNVNKFTILTPKHFLKGDSAKLLNGL